MDRIFKQTAGLVFTLTDTPDPVDEEAIHQEIKTFNDSVSAHHRAVRQAGPRPLDVFIRDDQGRLVGGLTAVTYWGWLEVKDLWLERALRGRGYGRELMLAVEAEAISRGCRFAFLRTFSFQAREFYEKLGYHVVGQLEDYPPGVTFFWMRKEFSY